MEKKIRAYGYCRISVKNEDGVSLDAQAHRIKAYCEYKGYELVHTIKDDGISGGVNRMRGGFVELLEIVESGKVDAVILFSLERLSRDMLTMLSIERFFDEYDVRLHTCEGEVSTESLDKWMSFVMKVLWSEVERRQVKFRTKKSMEYLKSQGQVVGTIPYGYMRVGDCLEEHPEEQEIIKIANNLYQEEKRLTEIAQNLSDKGFLTRANKTWNTTQVKRLLNGYQKKWTRKRSQLGEMIKNFILSVA